MYSELEMHVCG